VQLPTHARLLPPPALSVLLPKHARLLPPPSCPAGFLIKKKSNNKKEMSLIEYIFQIQALEKLHCKTK
jgi:hypothetical protein